MFQIKWLRRLLRRNMTPVPMDRATRWKQRLSVGYMLVAWNAFGLVLYMAYQGKLDWAEYYGLKSKEDKNIRPGIAWAKALNIDKGKIIKISGLTKVEEFEITPEETES